MYSLCYAVKVVFLNVYRRAYMIEFSGSYQQYDCYETYLLYEMKSLTVFLIIMSDSVFQ